eukprot:gene830-biopygen1643
MLHLPLPRGCVGPFVDLYGIVRLREGEAALTSPCLVDGNRLLVRDGQPRLVHHGRVADVKGEDERGRGDAPQGEVRAPLHLRQRAVRLVAVPDDKVVGVRPAAGAGDAVLHLPQQRPYALHPRPVPHAHIAAGAVEVPRAPRGVRHRPAPVAVLYHDRPPGLVKQLRPQRQIVLRAAPIELDPIEAEPRQRRHVRLVQGDKK